ncbi:hypothetical protein [Candidatus Spongiihabitans sp.]|uniref:hypothetical protein n=1 Tax=Candidatus Spongiihabitans sp. TaxID=3101308 RepID=UPI003C6F0D63
MKPLIEIRNPGKTFGREKAVNDVSLDIYDQEFLMKIRQQPHSSLSARKNCLSPRKNPRARASIFVMRP